MDDPSSETVSSKYYGPCELSSLLSNSKNRLSFFHLNISSLSCHIEELKTLISEPNLTFDIFGVRLQFVDTFFIVRLMPNMSMHCAVIINYYLSLCIENGG